MNKKAKIIMILTIIFLVALTVFCIYFYLENNKENINHTASKTEEKYFTVLSDGSKVNISSKLKENKQVDGLDITNIELVEKLNVTKLTGTITNNTNKEKGNYTAEIVLLDEKNNEISKASVYIKELKPQESTTLNAAMTFDYSNAYNFKIEVK